MKNGEIINSKLSDLKKIHIHNAALYKDFTFLKELGHLQSISIYNTNKLAKFPQIQNPEKIQSISLYNCPDLENIDELFTCENLEKLAIAISPLKKMKLKIEDFKKLGILKNLKTVYTDLGKITEDDFKSLEQVYLTNQWENCTF